MKGVKKCYGLLLALFIMVGLSLSVCSGFTSALKHEYLTIPIFPQTYDHPNSSSSTWTSSGFKLSFKQENAPTLNLKKQSFMYAVYNDSSNKCVFDSHGLQPHYQADSLGQSNLTFPSLFYGIWDSFSYNWAWCQTPHGFGHLLDSDFYSMPSVPEFNRDFFSPGLNSFYKQQILDNLPYPYEYNAFYLRDSYVAGDGIVYKTQFRFDSIQEGDPVIINKFYSLSIPFDPINQSIAGDMVSGRPLEFKGTFAFPGVSSSSGFSWASDFTSNGIFELQLYYSIPGSSIHSTKHIPCSITQTYSSGLEDGLDSMSLHYSCPYILEEDLTNGFLVPTLYIQAGSSGYVFDTISDWGWSGAFLTTDNDDTPGDPISAGCTGNACEEAPGSAEAAANNASQDDISWFDSLINLFHFNIINPFAPIWSMFSDQSSCASIPTFSSMLGSTETQVCPFFSSSTRQVLTPVFSIASIMLVFGFAIRWLGSSSGNMFEDQTTHKWGNTQIKQRGVK